MDLLAQALPDLGWMAVLKDATILTLAIAMLWYLERRDKAWRRHDVRQAKNCHDAQREMSLLSGEIAIVLGRAINVIEQPGSPYAYPAGHKDGPSDSQVRRERPLRAHIDLMRKNHEQSLTQNESEDEKDSKD